MTEVVFTLQSILNIQEITNSFLQATGKTKSGRRVTDDQNAGMELGFRMPNNRKLLILRDNIRQQNGSLSYKHYPKKIFQLTNSCFGSIQIFGPKDLKKATNNYADNMILGKGAQGTVYKGILPDKRVVAIKRHRILSQSRVEQLITEIVILESISHNNVVRLLGCCFKTEDAFLVYEFASNGSLHHLLHKGARGTGILSWDNRLKMAHETADALAYLHTYEKMSIIHRDVKSANILLDENYTAKISDFGSSMLIPLNRGQVITTDIPGTPGYVDPEYFSTSQPTHKSDVYGLGVVLTELLTGKKPFDREIDEDDKRLSTYFVKKTKDDGLLDIVDPQVLQEATDEQLSASRDLVYRCLEPLGVNRPSMKEVTMELDRIRKSGKCPGVS
ncbi:wall-associated receptor kinase 5-like [Bidens hawaiensis]|uniref:wall-associated receptor kinase 5-like n=1 Tax=Bidens hawaiensis TaxID=980011 RepID=UPI0040494658